MVLVTIIIVVVLVVVGASLLGIYLPGLLSGDGASPFPACDPVSEIIIPASEIEECPDPNNVCTKLKEDADARLEEIRDGFLLESRRESECEDDYCPLYLAFFRCKCAQCTATGGLSSDTCANECALSDKEFCEQYVNCALLID